ncbi:MAG: glycosyltransferase family 39 protein [Anaerolineae bacterium]|nr:glycosyltransferase family 39 protein [Anaerolineae bacterium]
MPGLRRWLGGQGGWIRAPVLRLCLILALYVALLLPTVGRQGISWDEQTDLLIAQSYLSQTGGWFVGSTSDPSQTRLPMATVAALWALSDSQSLYTGRLVSCAVGALTLVGVYVYCTRAHTSGTGLTACLILAASPFYLSFARVAFTETDVYVACAVAWVLVGMSRLCERGTLGWALFVAVTLGLAISAKFTAVSLLPAVAVELWLRPVSPRAEDASRRVDVGRAGIVVGLAAVATVDALLRVRAVTARADPAWCAYIAPFALWTMVVVWALMHRRQRVSLRASAFGVLALALTTSALVPPVHLTNPAILDALLDRLRNEMGVGVPFMVEAGALHVGCVLFKSSLPLGVGLLLAPVVAAWQARRRVTVRFPLLALFAYAGGLLALPIAQTFYAVPLLPVLAVLAADHYQRLRASRRALADWAGALVMCWLVVDLFRCYPDYNLNGYQYVGSRMLLGRSSIGYRSVVQTPSDGVEQLARWIDENVAPDERVAACVNPWHIVRAVLPDPGFVLVDVREQGLSTRPDYLITHINCEIQHGWGTDDPRGDVFRAPYDVDERDANYRKIGSVERAFGLEVASIWQRE